MESQYGVEQSLENVWSFKPKSSAADSLQNHFNSKLQDLFLSVGVQNYKPPGSVWKH